MTPPPTRTRLTWPDSQFGTYTFDAMNRVDLVRQSGTTLLADYDYHPLGQRSEHPRGNGADNDFGARPRATPAHCVSCSFALLCWPVTRIANAGGRSARPDPSDANAGIRDFRQLEIQRPDVFGRIFAAKRFGAIAGC
jgi:hypothetical protein